MTTVCRLLKQRTLQNCQRSPMKNLLLVSLSTAALLNYQASAQTTISITGTSGSINLSTTNFFDSQITLTINGTPPADVAGVDLLLETPDTGNNSAAAYFTVYFLSGSTSFPQSDSASSFGIQDTFTMVGTGANSGFLITEDQDLGASSSGNPLANTGSNINNLAVDTLRFTAAPNTPSGTYNFYATTGTFDEFGSDVRDSGGTEYDLTRNALFTITVVTAVPEPSTWPAGVLGVIGYIVLRRRATA